MGKLIDITGRLEAKRLVRNVGRGPAPEVFEEEAFEIAQDLFSDYAFVREPDLCQTCGQRSAAADVYRSDAVDSGLGGRLYCRRCLIAELRHNRLAPRCGKTEWLVAEILSDADDGDPVRVEITWDAVRQRAIRLDGVLLT